MFKHGSYIIDAGVYRSHSTNCYNSEYYSFNGDLVVDDGLYDRVSGFSGVPGGVGPLCVSNVPFNLLKAYCYQNRIPFNIIDNVIHTMDHK